MRNLTKTFIALSALALGGLELFKQRRDGQQRHRGPSTLGKERVVKTGDEK